MQSILSPDTLKKKSIIFNYTLYRIEMHANYRRESEFQIVKYSPMIEYDMSLPQSYTATVYTADVASVCMTRHLKKQDMMDQL